MMNHNDVSHFYSIKRKGMYKSKLRYRVTDRLSCKYDYAHQAYTRSLCSHIQLYTIGTYLEMFYKNLEVLSHYFHERPVYHEDEPNDV